MNNLACKSTIYLSSSRATGTREHGTAYTLKDDVTQKSMQEISLKDQPAWNDFLNRRSGFHCTQVVFSQQLACSVA